MEQFFEKVTTQQDAFDKLGLRIPGFKGYVERQTRRDADKLLRDTVARRYEEHWKRASQLQSDMVSSGLLAFVDDMEKASIQLRTFIDKITTAPRGYAGLFDAIKINEPELQALYQFDYAFFDLSDQIGRALDHVETNMGDKEALPAAIHNLISLARLAVETYNRRAEAFTGTGR